LWGGRGRSLGGVTGLKEWNGGYTLQTHLVLGKVRYWKYEEWRKENI
jgi:hypothetical protein